MLSYDDANMWAQTAGSSGATPAEWKRMVPRLRAAKRGVQKMVRLKEQGFLDLPFDRNGHAAATALARKMSRSFTDLVVLGIGGSDLGGRMLKQALSDTDQTRGKTMRVHFAGSTTDPEILRTLIKNLNLKKTCINIVSKSGGTLEPMAVFDVLRKRLVHAVGEKHAGQHIVATTDPVYGELRTLAKKERYLTLPIPANVGGRYSVLSAVGIFPAAMMGIDTEALLLGARVGIDRFHDLSPSQDSACRFAGLHALGAEKRGQTIQVTIPYVARLSEFGRWVRQLIAESLGKKKNRNGRTVYAGLTPIACMGPEDQHSQLQLWSEGPRDKQITFIETGTFKHDVHSAYGSFQDLIHAERSATAEALHRDGRPNGTLFVERLDARALGELIVFFELSVAMLGELFNINAYDQPGVELMKKLMKKA